MRLITNSRWSHRRPMSRSFFVAIELSRSTWVVAIQPPAVDKVSLFRNAGGEIERLFELFEQARRHAGQPIEICACYEAGYDGFWIAPRLTQPGQLENLL
jgi:transposase